MSDIGSETSSDSRQGIRAPISELPNNTIMIVYVRSLLETLEPQLLSCPLFFEMFLNLLHFSIGSPISQYLHKVNLL